MPPKKTTATTPKGPNKQSNLKDAGKEIAQEIEGELPEEMPDLDSLDCCGCCSEYCEFAKPILKMFWCCLKKKLQKVGDMPDTDGLPTDTDGLPTGTDGLPTGTDGLPSNTDGLPTGTRKASIGVNGITAQQKVTGLQAANDAVTQISSALN